MDSENSTRHSEKRQKIENTERFFELKMNRTSDSYRRKMAFEMARYKFGNIPVRELNSGGCEFLNEFFGLTKIWVCKPTTNFIGIIVNSRGFIVEMCPPENGLAGLFSVTAIFSV